MKNNIKTSTISIALTLLVMLSLSCTNKKGAENALKDAGYHPIEVGGYGWFDCSEDDMYATRFRAYSPDSSRIVKGCVCQGMFKGKTIRLD
jgi:hypothetical protein